MAENLPARVEDVIANRIRAQFVELIPEAAFTEMVKKQIEWFTDRKHAQYHGYSGREETTPLTVLIRMELQKRFNEALGKELDKPEYRSTMWQSNGAPVMGDAVRQIIKECLPEIVAAAWGSSFQMAIESLRNSMPRI